MARWERSQWLAAALLFVLAVAATVLHLRAGYTFPRPWPDEAHFITPALTLAQQARLAVPELNAVEGIFWMPTGFYVAQAPFILAGIDPLVAGRLLSLLGVVGFAWGVCLAVIRAGVSRWVAGAALLAWLCLPRVVAIGNIARMEGVILGLVGACLWLVSTDRWPYAVAVALLAPLVHPIGVVVPVAVAAAALLRSERRPWSSGERVVLLVVMVLYVAEAVYFATHADVAAAHLRFQFTRKAGRPITLQWWQWLLLATTAVGGAVATWRWWRAGHRLAAMEVALALAGAFVLVDVVGREMWYEFLGRETTVLLAGMVAVAAATRWPLNDVQRRLTGALLAVVVLVAALVGLRGTLAGGWYGMRAIPGSRAEWHDFTGHAVGELRRLDIAATAPVTVVVDPLSGFGQEVVTESWRNLRFVQPTPATPLDTTTADYVLATPGVPFVTDALVSQWGALAPAVEVRSSAGTFTMQLFANPNAG